MAVTRRKFLKSAGVLAGAAALGAIWKPGLAHAGEDFSGYADRFGMLTDTTMCIGCRMCEAACNKVNRLPEPDASFSDPAVFAKMRRPSARALTVVNRYPNPQDGGKPIYRKVQCMHCDEPACASACLVGALQKTREGAVVYDESLCIECRYCMNACPFSMLGYEYDNALTPAIKKCLMCRQRVVNEGSIPACAEACPTKATIFGKRSELIKIARERIEKNPDRYVDHIYGEHEVGGTSWLYLAAVPFDQLGLPTNLGTTPYPEYTRDWLLGVPLVLVMWPALFMGLRKLVNNHRDETANAEVISQQTKE